MADIARIPTQQILVGALPVRGGFLGRTYNAGVHEGRVWAKLDAIRYGHTATTGMTEEVEAYLDFLARQAGITLDITAHHKAFRDGFVDGHESGLAEKAAEKA